MASAEGWRHCMGLTIEEFNEKFRRNSLPATEEEISEILHGAQNSIDLQLGKGRYRIISTGED